jgi:hypothetical protein
MRKRDCDVTQVVTGTIVAAQKAQFSGAPSGGVDLGHSRTRLSKLRIRVAAR